MVAAGDQLVQRVGPGGYRLGLQGLRFKGGRHFRRRDPHQVVRQSHLPDGIAVQHPQRPLAVVNSLGRRDCLLLGRGRSGLRLRQFRRLDRPLGQSPRQQKQSQQRRRRNGGCFFPDAHGSVLLCLSGNR